MDFYTWLKAQWDRVAAAALMVGGLVSLLLGYEGISHSTLPTQQIPYLASGGLLGIFCLGGAATLWLSADLRDEWRKLDEIHRDLRAQNRDATPPTVTPLQAAQSSPLDMTADTPTGQMPPIAVAGATTARSRAARQVSSEKPKSPAKARLPRAQGAAK